MIKINKHLLRRTKNTVTAIAAAKITPTAIATIDTTGIFSSSGDLSSFDSPIISDRSVLSVVDSSFEIPSDAEVNKAKWRY